jgi:hypothetical protein
MPGLGCSEGIRGAGKTVGSEAVSTTVHAKSPSAMRLKTPDNFLQPICNINGKVQRARTGGRFHAECLLVTNDKRYDC